VEQEKLMSKKFTYKDKVKWRSGAGGRYTKKAGEVVVVVPPFAAPPHFSKLRDRYGAKDAYGGGSRRDHESYIVLVPHPGKGKPTLYWPRVSGLEKA
jgi:hypothetical protein